MTHDTHMTQCTTCAILRPTWAFLLISFFHTWTWTKLEKLSIKFSSQKVWTIYVHCSLTHWQNPTGNPLLTLGATYSFNFNFYFVPILPVQFSGFGVSRPFWSWKQFTGPSRHWEGDGVGIWISLREVRIKIQLWFNVFGWYSASVFAGGPII